MASVIKQKRSDVAGRVPAPADIDYGELAINPTDRKIFAKNASDVVVEMGGGSGGGTTYTLEAATQNGETAISLEDGSGGTFVPIIGTANEINVIRSGTGNIKVQIGLPDDISVTRDITAGRNLTTTGAVTVSDTTAATSATTGSLKVAGGAGIAGDLFVGDDLTVTGDTHIDGNLTVEGGTTHIATSTVDTDDGMVKLSANNVADTVDSGIYALHIDSTINTYSGYFRDATDGHFKFYTGLRAEPGTTVNTSGAGYTLAQVDAIIDGGTY